MTVLIGDVKDVGLKPTDGTVTVFSTVTRRATGTSGIVTRERRDYPLSAGRFRTGELDPGRTTVELVAPGVFESWTFDLPTDGTVSLADMIENSEEYQPSNAVVNAAQAAAAQAERFAGEAAGSAAVAGRARDEAVQAQASVSRVVESATAIVRGEFTDLTDRAESAAVRAEQARDAAEGSADGAAGSAASAKEDADRAEQAAGKAATTAADQTRAELAGFAQAAAQSEQNAAGSAAAAGASATAAAGSADGAAASATAAQGHAEDAASDAATASSARDAAVAAADAAAGSATEASTHADRAEGVVDSVQWDDDRLTVAGKTSPSLRGPRGERGEQGPQGGSQYVVETYTGDKPTVSGANGLAVGRGATAAEGGMAIGSSAQALAAWSTALGAFAKANSESSAAIGTQAAVDAAHDNSVAIGAWAKTTASRQVRIGRADNYLFHVSLAGDVRLTNAPSRDDNATTKAYVDGAVAEAKAQLDALAARVAALENNAVTSTTYRAIARGTGSRSDTIYIQE